jgi:hypothetical protein
MAIPVIEFVAAAIFKYVAHGTERALGPVGN